MGNLLSDTAESATKPIVEFEEQLGETIRETESNFVNLIETTEGNVVKVITNTENDILTGYVDTEQNITHLIGDTSTKVVATIDNQFDNLFKVMNKYETDLFSTIQFGMVIFFVISGGFVVVLADPKIIKSGADAIKKINVDFSLI